ncbi:unnamed protein product [Ranitomeya imitator]|uniref:Uncharacterized protein n=1 Tax=Ranitomeya imitator TaxID=111125 RepID=A0ABN9LXE5_9NEOB|nr:unnamed protein product [Ranitomeya imitator]
MSSLVTQMSFWNQNVHPPWTRVPKRTSGRKLDGTKVLPGGTDSSKTGTTVLKLLVGTISRGSSSSSTDDTTERERASARMFFSPERKWRVKWNREKNKDHLAWREFNRWAVCRVDENIIQTDYDRGGGEHIPEDVVHKVLENGWGITEPEGHHQIFIVPIPGVKSRLPFVPLTDANQVEKTTNTLKSKKKPKDEMRVPKRTLT